MRYTLTEQCSHTDLDSAANPWLWLVSPHLSPAVIGQCEAISGPSVVVAGDVSYLGPDQPWTGG